MKGLGFIGENPTMDMKTNKSDVSKVVCYVVLYKLQQKTLTFCHQDSSLF